MVFVCADMMLKGSEEAGDFFLKGKRSTNCIF